MFSSTSTTTWAATPSATRNMSRSESNNYSSYWTVLSTVYSCLLDTENPRSLRCTSPPRIPPISDGQHGPEPRLADAKSGSRLGDLRAYRVGLLPRLRGSCSVPADGGFHAHCWPCYR